MDVALKATYNDGNKGNFIGFKGVCTRDTIVSNMDKVNCSLPSNPCKIFYDSGLNGPVPSKSEPCYESRLFIDWKFGAGMYHNRSRKGQPIPIIGVKPGDLAVVTTRFPGETEENRIIVGIFKIAQIDNTQQSTMGTMLVADKVARLELTEEIARQLKYWDYHNPVMGKRKEWHEGLFRYMKEDETDAILNALRQLIVDEDSRTALENLRQASPPRNGSNLTKLDPAVKRVLLNRKYGPGGEGKEHRELKEWVANHSDFLGLQDVIDIEIEEHRFPSNDLPDIVFKLKNGWAAVEIETTNPLPGAYQAIKYRSLLCAQQKLNLDDPNVTTFLVAYDFSEDLKDFCQKYQIKAFTKKMP